MKVNVGIFWVIKGNIYKAVEVIEKSDKISQTEIIDSKFEHITLWDKILKSQFSNDDFATYPRGRVMYSQKQNRYIIYIDNCITEKEKIGIINEFEIENNEYCFMPDLHYRCDKCLKNELRLWVINNGEGYSTCQLLDDEIIESDFFSYEEKNELLNYCKDCGAYDEHTNKYLFVTYNENINDSIAPTFKENRNYINTLQKGDNAYYYMFNMSGHIKGSQNNTFKSIAKYYGINDNYTAENIANCYLKLYFDTQLNEIKAKAVVDDCRELLNNDLYCFESNTIQNIFSNSLKGGSRFGENIVKLYNYSFYQDNFEISEQTALNLLGDYLENTKLTKILNANISWAIQKAKHFIQNDEVFDNSTSYEFKKYYENNYKFCLRAYVLRGENELTGNLIKVTNGYYKFMLECGNSLANKSKQLEEIEQKVINEYRDFIVTHNHIDHIGLIEKLHPRSRIYMGELTKKLMLLKYKNLNNKNIISFKDGQPFYIKQSSLYKGMEIKITPYLCDHSEPDSYMLLIEFENKKILYTGDFRAHGRKNYNKLLLNLPAKTDTLILEGTNCLDNKKMLSEIAVQNKISKLLVNNEKPIFVLVPTENIDRIVSVYKAAKNNKRIILVDMDEAKKLEIIGKGVPHPTSFNDIFVYYPQIIKKEHKNNYVNFKKQSLSYKDIALKNDYVMIIKSSSINYIKKIAKERTDGLQGATLIYSMWNGYKNEAEMKIFLHQIKLLGINIVSVHTSGHVDNYSSIRLINRVKPNVIVKVHCKNKKNM